jgi:hypothetical protein
MIRFVSSVTLRTLLFYLLLVRKVNPVNARYVLNVSLPGDCSLASCLAGGDLDE